MEADQVGRIVIAAVMASVVSVIGLIGWGFYLFCQNYILIYPFH